MSTTAQWVFDKAMAISDQLSETGAADHEYDQDLKNRALPILNVLRVECVMASADFLRRGVAGKRVIGNEIKAWDSMLDGIDDGVAQGAMPYGLAAQLLLDEDPDAASFCNQKYQEMLSYLRLQVPQEMEMIEYPYGRKNEYGEGGRW